MNKKIGILILVFDLLVAFAFLFNKELILPSGTDLIDGYIISRTLFIIYILGCFFILSLFLISDKITFDNRQNEKVKISSSHPVNKSFEKIL